jgi:hypothetical protein
LPKGNGGGIGMRGTIVVAVLAALSGSMGAAQDGRLTVELNKFEDGADGAGCRAFFLFRNDSGAGFEEFEMSLAILDPQGVIDRLLTIDAAPLPADRTTLKLFEIPQTACADISEVLLHDVSRCKPQNAPETDCFALMDLASRTAAPLVK